MKRLLSLFDHSGNWPSEFYYNGWDVRLFDLRQGEDINDIIDAGTALDMFEHIDGIIAAVPCTDFSNSGSRWWKRKDESGQTEASMELVRQTLRLANLFTPTDPDFYEEGGTFFWALENPVGRIGTLFPEIGDPYYFNPCEFAGYLNLSASDHNELDRIRMKDGHGVTAEERDFVIRCNAYNKRTGLWGKFNRELRKDPVEPVRCNKYGSPMMSFGGGSASSMASRSVTPFGFSKAFYQANKDYSVHFESDIYIDG